MTDAERYRQFIANAALYGDETSKLARRVLAGMTLDEARCDLNETRNRQAEASRRDQAALTKLIWPPFAGYAIGAPLV